MIGPRETQPWEPWEARRLTPPPGLPVELREARADARLVLFVARARFREGTVPWDLADRLAGVAQDELVTVRTRRVAASLLAKLRGLALARARLAQDAPGGPGLP
ncbi:MAG: hypothetical protein AB7T63_17330 [Planctomycetota bacterium]